MAYLAEVYSKTSIALGLSEVPCLKEVASFPG